DQGDILGHADGVIEGGHDLDAIGDVIGLAGDDDVGAAGQRALEGFPGLPSHDDGFAEGDALEVLQVVGEVPGQLVVAADAAVGGAGDDQGQHHYEVPFTASGSRWSDGHRRLDMRIGFVANQFEILEAEREQVFHVRIDFYRRQCTRRARQLQVGLLQMIRVKVCVAEGVDEVTRLQAADLRHHQREQTVRGNVERYAKENITAALVQLARQFSVGHIKLE